MASNRMRPIHPGEILREEFLVPLGMSANALAMALHVPAPRINDIVRERRAVTPDTALRLARYFDTTAQYWLNLHTAFDLKQVEREAGGKIAEEVRPMKRATSIFRLLRCRGPDASGADGPGAQGALQRVQRWYIWNIYRIGRVP
ncbi:MAG: HigA family addiction module antidote protein [Rhodocyclaceae bacterium]|nr:HigA family addiction module antidote protein [Rhodocyclaceae bacterium]